MPTRVIQGCFVKGWPPGATRAPGVQPEPSRTEGPYRSAAAAPTAIQAKSAHRAFPVNPGTIGLAIGGGKPLPEPVRGKMEAALNSDFSAVRVHVGPQAERVGAIAFTIGADIYFAPGRYQPDTARGQQLLGHELAHVVQQRQGRVRSPMGAGVAVVWDRALEEEADRLGRRAATERPGAHVEQSRPGVASQRFAASPRKSAIVQRAKRNVPTTPVWLDHSAKSYRDEDGIPVKSPGKKGYVCAPTQDGKIDVCKYFSRMFYESMNDLSAPGQYSVRDPSRPDLSGEARVFTTSSPVKLSDFTLFEKDK